MKIQLHPIDKEALAKTFGVLAMSWLALPVIYWLIVHKKKGEEKENGSGNTNINGNIGDTDIHGGEVRSNQ